MVEIIRDVKELRRNIINYVDSENEYISNEYNNFRRRIVKVLRAINRLRFDDNKEASYNELLEMRKTAKTTSEQSYRIFHFRESQCSIKSCFIFNDRNCDFAYHRFSKTVYWFALFFTGSGRNHGCILFIFPF